MLLLLCKIVKSLEVKFFCIHVPLKVEASTVILLYAFLVVFIRIEARRRQRCNL